MARRLAIIPARGGSKRIPEKNIRDFCGKPMIAHILEVVRASNLFEQIHVSTDCRKICRVVEGLGFEVPFLRPSEISDDHTPIMPVLKHVTDEFIRRGKHFDEIWQLMACAPFVTVSDLLGAAKRKASAEPQHSIIAVARYPVPVEWAYRRLASGHLTPLQPGMFAVRSQDLQPAFFDTGTFVVYSPETVQQSSGAGTDTNFIGFELDRRRVVDIDDEADWELAQTLFTVLTAKQMPCELNDQIQRTQPLG